MSHIDRKGRKWASEQWRALRLIEIKNESRVNGKTNVAASKQWPAAPLSEILVVAADVRQGNSIGPRGSERRERRGANSELTRAAVN